MRAARIPWPPAPQSPLQPLQDNLESQTYETFERDGTKYTTYEEAVYRCLLDRVPQVGGAQRWRAAGWGPRPAGLCTSRHARGRRHAAGMRSWAPLSAAPGASQPLCPPAAVALPAGGGGAAGDRADGGGRRAGPAGGCVAARLGARQAAPSVRVPWLPCALAWPAPALPRRTMHRARPCL